MCGCRFIILGGIWFSVSEMSMEARPLGCEQQRQSEKSKLVIRLGCEQVELDFSSRSIVFYR